MWGKSIFSRAIIPILPLVMSSCSIQIHGTRALDDNLLENEDGGNLDDLTSSTSSFSLEEILLDASGDMQGLVFNKLHDTGAFPTTQIQCTEDDDIILAPLYTFFQLTDSKGVLSGQLVFTMAEGEKLIDPCFVPVFFSGETLSLTIGGKSMELNYE